MMKHADNAVELWAKEVEKAEKVQLPIDVAPDYIRIVFVASKIDLDEEALKQLEEKKLGLASLFWLRVKYCHSYEITPSVAFLVSVVANNPGTAVMISNYVQYKAFKHNVKKVDSEFFNTYCFPMGFPTEETWHKLWDMQKVERRGMESDNLLDYAANQKSITLK